MAAALDSSDTLPSLRNNPENASIKIKPLKAVLAALPPTPFPPVPSRQDSLPRRIISLPSLRSYGGEESSKEVRTVIPSSSSRSTLEKTPTLSHATLAQNGSPGFLRSISSTPRLPPTRPSSRAPDHLAPTTIYSGSAHKHHPLSVYRAVPYTLLARPMSEVEWFSPIVQAPSSWFDRKGGGGGGKNFYHSSSPRGTHHQHSAWYPTHRPVDRPRLFKIPSNPSNAENRKHGRAEPDPEGLLSVHPTSADTNSCDGYGRRKKLLPRRSEPPTTQPTTRKILPVVPIAKGPESSEPNRPPTTRGRLRAASTPTKASRASGAVVVAMTLWEDELTVVLSIVVNGHAVGRRLDNDWINCTKLLNLVGMTRGKRDSVLKVEQPRVVFRKGVNPLKGVWLPIESAIRLAREHAVEDQLYPLFEPNLSTWLFTPTNSQRTLQFLQACRGREVLQEGDEGLMPLITGGDRDQVGKDPKSEPDYEGKLDAFRARKRGLIGILGNLEVGLGLTPGPSQAALPRVDPARSARPSLSRIEDRPQEEEEAAQEALSSPPAATVAPVSPSTVVEVRSSQDPTQSLGAPTLLTASETRLPVDSGVFEPRNPSPDESSSVRRKPLPNDLRLIIASHETTIEPLALANDPNRPEQDPQNEREDTDTLPASISRTGSERQRWSPVSVSTPTSRAPSRSRSTSVSTMNRLAFLPPSRATSLPPIITSQATLSTTRFSSPAPLDDRSRLATVDPSSNLRDVGEAERAAKRQKVAHGERKYDLDAGEYERSTDGDKQAWIRKGGKKGEKGLGAKEEARPSLRLRRM